VVFDVYTGVSERLGLTFSKSEFTEMPSKSRAYIAIGHPETAIEELRSHAKHEHHLIRLRVAEHPNSTHDLLRSLADDEHVEIRIAVSEHPDTPNEVLQRLLKDANVDVRYALAENPLLPAEMLKQLVDDENAYVSHRAQKTLQSLNNGTTKKLPETHAGSNPTRRHK
jgi:hypothetical protein